MPAYAPTPEYSAAVVEQGLGAAWSSDDDDLTEFAYSFLSFSRRMRQNLTPASHTNQVGRNFSFEFAYVDAFDFPNAYAFSDSNENMFVGITTTLVGLIARVCDEIFADESIEGVLGEEPAILAGRKIKLTPDMIDLDEKTSAVLANFLSEQDEMPREAPSGWRTEFAVVDDILFATSAKYRVRDTILAFIFNHEMGHLVEGHVGLLSERYGARAVREGDGYQDTAQRLAMEFQADSSASKSLAILANVRRGVLRHYGLESDWNLIVTLDLLAIYVAHTILAISAYASEHLSRGRELSGDDLKNIFLQNALYPSVGVRTITALNTYINGIEAVEAGFDQDAQGEIYDDDMTTARFQHIIKILADKYVEFTMMLIATRVNVGDLQNERRKIHNSDAVRLLSEACDPYSFRARDA